jgi:outer membrane protein assembly factor BamB
MAWNPATRLVYLPMQNNQSWYDRVPVQYLPGQFNTGTARGPDVVRPPAPALQGPVDALKAWDPVENREVWRMDTDGMNGGVLSTGGGLLFWGTRSRMGALDARSGGMLWESPVGDQPATPITYELDGRQYVTILAGNAPPRVWTYTLP